MSNGELAELVRRGHPYRGKAVFQLADRARRDDDAATHLGELTRLPLLRDDRVFHRVSLAWSAIIGLLAAETSHSRTTAYASFADLPEGEQQDLLDYLGCQRIEDAHPRI